MQPAKLWRFMSAILFALLLIGGTATAAEPDFTFLVKDGKYHLVEFQNGVPITRPVSLRFVEFGGPSVPPPIDPALSERAKSFQSAASAVGDPANAKKLAALFLGLLDQVKTGAIKDRAKLEQVMATALDLFLSDPQTKTRWAPVRKLLNDQWAKLIQEGATLAQHGVLLSDVAAGLDASAGSQAAISVATILKILTLIMSQETLDLKTILEILSLIANEL